MEMSVNLSLGFLILFTSIVMAISHHETRKNYSANPLAIRYNLSLFQVHLIDFCATMLFVFVGMLILFGTDRLISNYPYTFASCLVVTIVYLLKADK